MYITKKQKTKKRIELEMTDFLVEEPYYISIELKKNKVFGSKENLLGLGIKKLEAVYSLPRLTKNKIYIDLLLRDENETLRPSKMSIDLSFVRDIKFNRKSSQLIISYAFPKIETGWFGRGSNKGKIEFQTVKFTEWQNLLTKRIMKAKKKTLNPEIERTQDDLTDITARIEGAKQQLLNGSIDQDSFNMVTKDWMRKQKTLEKDLRRKEKNLSSMR